MNIIGHPTGRLINRREGLPLDMAKIFKAAEHGVALEINAGYPRLDLNEINARGAIDAGCVLSIDADTPHSTDGLDEIDYGISVARRAWVTPKQVINCWTFAELSKFLKNRRSR